LVSSAIQELQILLVRLSLLLLKVALGRLLFAALFTVMKATDEIVVVLVEVEALLILNLVQLLLLAHFLDELVVILVFV